MTPNVCFSLTDQPIDIPSLTAELEERVLEIETDFYAQPRDQGAGISYVMEAYRTSKEQYKTKRRVEVSVRQLNREE